MASASYWFVRFVLACLFRRPDALRIWRDLHA